MARNKSKLRPAVAPPGEQKEGYVLVKAILTRGAPDSVVPGVPRYPRMLYGEHWWIHPDDLAGQPLYFEALPEEPLAPPPAPEEFPETPDAPSGVLTMSLIPNESGDRPDLLLKGRDGEPDMILKGKKPRRREELKELLAKHE